MLHAEIQHFSRAPITEAVIDIRVRLVDGANVEALVNLSPSIADEYPTRETLHIFQGEFEISSGTVAQAKGRDLGVQGYRFVSAKRTAVVQFRLDGFTFSRLRPYTDWLQVLAEAQRLWSCYVAVAPVEALLRLAVRYINNFSIPPGARPGDYLVQPPVLPPGIDHGVVKAALSRVLATDRDTRSNCLVTQALERTADDGISVVLDIDAHKPVNLGPTVDFWAEFQQLHDVKNRIFFSSITGLAAREFE